MVGGTLPATAAERVPAGVKHATPYRACLWPITNASIRCNMNTDAGILQSPLLR